MNIVGIRSRLQKVQEKIAPTTKSTEITIVREFYVPGLDAEGNSKPRKCGSPLIRTVTLEV